MALYVVGEIDGDVTPKHSFQYVKDANAYSNQRNGLVVFQPTSIEPHSQHGDGDGDDEQRFA